MTVKFIHEEPEKRKDIAMELDLAPNIGDTIMMDYGGSHIVYDRTFSFSDNILIVIIVWIKDKYP